MIKVMIIDDEKHCITTLQHLLKNFKDEVEVVATTQQSIHAKALIEEHKPHLVFLDIEMPIMNGLELLEQFTSLPFETIFTTAYDQYAIKALRLSALDYLLKPIDKQELKAALEKYKSKELVTTQEQVQQVKKITQQKIMDTLALSTIEGLLFIKMKDIMYLEATSCYTTVFMSNGTKYLASKTLATFEEVMDEVTFFRPHKSYIINLKNVKQYIRGEGGEIIMENGTSISLSRNKKQQFLEMFMRI